MKVEWNSKYTTISVYSIIVFAICMLLVMVTIQIPAILAGLKAIIATLSPIIWGIVIAYLLNPVMKAVEKLCKRLFEKNKPHPKLCRAISTFAAVVFGIAVIASLVAIIVPRVLDSLMSIFSNVPTYMNNIYNWANTTLVKYPEILDYLNNQLASIQSAVISAVNNLIPKVGDWAVKLKDGALGFAGALKDFLIGFIVSVYVLADKEKFQAQIRKLTTAIFPDRFAKEIFRLADRTNRSLSGFISGKILDSFIIGMICFVVMTIFGWDYAVLISTIIGVTNIIPFFGPIIGAVPSALLLLLSTPSQTIPFIIMVLVLQQFDGNILGPKILGDSTGLSAFWVMFAIFVGGGLFGFAGMLLGVPLFAVLYTFAQEIIEYLLKVRGKSTNTDDYFIGEPQPAAVSSSDAVSSSAADEKKTDESKKDKKRKK